MRSSWRRPAAVVSAIRDGDHYMLWDTGLPTARLGKGGTSVGGGPAVLSTTILQQLAQLQIDPKLIEIVALSPLPPSATEIASHRDV